VGCSFEKVVPDESHRASITDAVVRVHRSTILATELLNIYVRDRLENHGGAGLESILDANWLFSCSKLTTR
jgi:hypothetical protein